MTARTSCGATRSCRTMQARPESTSRPFNRRRSCGPVTEPLWRSTARERPGRELACAGVAVHGTIGLVGGGAAASGLADALSDAVTLSGAYAGVSSLPGECGLLVRILADDGAMLARAVDDVMAAVAQCPRSVL